MEIILEVKDLCKSYSGTTVLTNISLDIYKEDFTVIMGSSGSGKSTLLYCVSGMDNPTSGSVRLLNDEITKKKEKVLSKIRQQKMGFIFQQMNLLPNLTLLENTVTPAYLLKKDYKKDKERAFQLLEKFGISELANRYPSQVSGGQLQRSAIARALINQPAILFADEPTGALNSASGKTVLDIMTDYNNELNQTILMVTHDIKAATRANRIIYLSDGNVKGKLSLEKYNSLENTEKREAKIYQWLNEMGW